MSRTVTFIVPALNEEKNLAATIHEITNAASDLADYEIVIVNDGSTDRTGAVAEELAQKDPHVRVIHNATNQGLGGAYKIGVANARCNYAIMIPGDNNHPSTGIKPILAKVGQADVVIPYVANPQVRGFKRQFISSCYTRLLNTVFGLNVPYYNGLVLHRTELLRSITIETNGHAYQSEALIKLLRRGATSTAVPVEIAHEGDRNTRAFRFKNVVRVAETILRLRFEKPSSR